MTATPALFPPAAATTSNRPTARPLVAVTSAEILTGPNHVAGAPDRLGFSRTYMRAIAAAGGVPVCAFNDPGMAEQLVDSVDAVLISGGPDVNAHRYGMTPHPTMTNVAEDAADEFELTLLAAAEQRGLPVLAVCRGMQLLNVHRGGTLIQHLPDVPGTHSHSSKPGDQAGHIVLTEPGTRLSELTSGLQLTVNTFHHQAVDRLGAGLRISARAADGTVEGIEDPAMNFMVGVQWHPESIQHLPEQRALFTALIAAASA